MCTCACSREGGCVQTFSALSKTHRNDNITRRQFMVFLDRNCGEQHATHRCIVSLISLSITLRNYLEWTERNHYISCIAYMDMRTLHSPCMLTSSHIVQSLLEAHCDRDEYTSSAADQRPPGPTDNSVSLCQSCRMSAHILESVQQ